MNDIAPTRFKWVGTRPIRPDGVPKVTGRAMYGADFATAGTLYGKVLRSPHAHARIRSIDVSAARRAPGVVGVFTAADLGGAGEPMPIYAPHPALPVPCRIRPSGSTIAVPDTLLTFARTIHAISV